MTSSKDEVVFKPGEKGLLRSLGPLETAIMESIWIAGKRVSVDYVLNRLKDSYRELRYTTVASTMNRMEKKGLLSRKRSDGAHYYYEAVENRDGYNRRVIYTILDSIYMQDRQLFSDWSTGLKTREGKSK